MIRKTLIYSISTIFLLSSAGLGCLFYAKNRINSQDKISFSKAINEEQYLKMEVSGPKLEIFPLKLSLKNADLFIYNKNEQKDFKLYSLKSSNVDLYFKNILKEISIKTYEDLNISYFEPSSQNVIKHNFNISYKEPLSILLNFKKSLLFSAIQRNFENIISALKLEMASGNLDYNNINFASIDKLQYSSNLGTGDYVDMLYIINNLNLQLKPVEFFVPEMVNKYVKIQRIDNISFDLNSNIREEDNNIYAKINDFKIGYNNLNALKLKGNLNTSIADYTNIKKADLEADIYKFNSILNLMNENEARNEIKIIRIILEEIIKRNNFSPDYINFRISKDEDKFLIGGLNMEDFLKIVARKALEEHLQNKMSKYLQNNPTANGKNEKVKRLLNDLFNTESNK